MTASAPSQKSNKAEKTNPPKKPFVHPKAIVGSDSIGSGTRVWAFANVMKGAVIGENCNICDQVFVESGARIGNRVTVKNGVSVWTGVTLEDDVFAGPNAAFTNDMFPANRGGRFKLVPTLVKRGASIGANATIVCGVVLGEYAMVGAGAVVTRDLPDYALAYGNPARVRGYLCSCREKLAFKAGAARCVCGKTFKKRGSKVTVTR